MDKITEIGSRKGGKVPRGARKYEEGGPEEKETSKNFIVPINHTEESSYCQIATTKIDHSSVQHTVYTVMYSIFC
jgi:hypothetical protein